MKVLKLKKKEYEVLVKHWSKDISYGWNGTFGGYDEKDTRSKRKMEKELEIAKQILLKLIKK